MLFFFKTRKVESEKCLIQKIEAFEIEDFPDFPDILNLLLGKKPSEKVDAKCSLRPNKNAVFLPKVTSCAMYELSESKKTGKFT